MKRLVVLALCALSLSFNACEKHPAAQLPEEHETEFAKYLGGHSEHGAKEGAHHDAKPGEHSSAALHDAPHGEAKPADAAHGDPHAAKPAGEAPKFFPEKK